MFARCSIAFFVLAALLFIGCGDAGRLARACTGNASCADDEYCASGFCGGFGECVVRPDPAECEEQSNNPVCGCDGITYPKRCEAQIAGMQLQFSGACICEDNSGCASGQFCDLENSCANMGFCVDVPETCEPDDTQEVCGCDGNSYANACGAARAEVRVSALGACECQTDEDCAAGDYCKAIVCDGPGVCAARDAPACDPVAPVEGCCDPDGTVVGCDGRVYESECAAISSGVRVRPDS